MNPITYARIIILTLILCVIGQPALAASFLDADGDGMSDVWQRLYGISSSQANDDPDGDGRTNVQESFAGTDPNDPYSAFGADAVRADTGEIIIEWPSVAQKRYQVENTLSLTNADWQPLGAIVLGNDEYVSITDVPSGTRAFYRVKLVPSLNSDIDGLDDWEETLVGTDITLADTDGDTLSDSDEFLGLTNPTNQDTDGDGLSDLEELTVYFTDPRNRDTDGDQVDDGTEVGASAAATALAGSSVAQQQGVTNPLDPTDGFPANAEKRQAKVRMFFRGTWPNYSGAPPPIPAINFAIGSAASITQAIVNTATATPGGFYFGSTNNATDKSINRGTSYPYTLTFAGAVGTWPTVVARSWGSPNNVGGDRVNLLVYSTPGGVGRYFISNDEGGIWREDQWQSTGNDTISNTASHQLEARNNGTGTLWAVHFDLDVDSDNNNGISVSPRALAEEDIEETQAKLVAVNSNDDDNDGTPDFQDLAVANETDLVPVVLEVAPNDLEWDKVKVKFRYSGNPTYNSGQLGELRLWKKNSSRATRVAADYLAPDQIYTAAQLGLDANSTQLKLLVEGLNVQTANSLIEAVFIFNDREYFHDAVAVRVQGERVEFKNHNPLNTVLYVPRDGGVNTQGRVTIAADAEISANPNFNVGNITSSRGSMDMLAPNAGITNTAGKLNTVLTTTTLSAESGAGPLRVQFQGQTAPVQSAELNVAFPVTYENTFLITAYTTSDEDEFAGTVVADTELRVGGERAYYFIHSTVAARSTFLREVSVEGYGILTDNRVVRVANFARRQPPAVLPAGTNRSWAFFDITIDTAPGQPLGSTGGALVDGQSAAIVRDRGGQGVVIPSRASFVVQGQAGVRIADDRVSSRQGNYHIDLYMIAPRAVVQAFKIRDARVILQSYAP